MGNSSCPSNFEVKKIILIALLVCNQALATTWQSDGSSANIQSIHDSKAANGDTITLPAGTFHWSSPNPVLNITKAITLTGEGIGNTIIVDDMTAGKLMQWTLRANAVSRMTGIEIQYGGHRANFQGGPGGLIHIDGKNNDGSQFRFDHNKYNHSMGLIIPDTVMGVFDHNQFVHTAAGTFLIYGSHWDGQPNGYDYSWHEPTNFGSSQFTFIEDNTITNLSTTTPTYFTDALAGARFVIRYNNFLGAVISDHGTESSGRQRGSRAFEVYKNTFNGNNLASNLGGSRSSRVIWHHNTISNYSKPTFNLNAFRNHWSFANSFFYGMNGANPWDVNDTTGGPNHDGIYFTGTAAAANSGTIITVSGSPGWSSNQWVGYVLRRTTDNCTSGTINFGEITASTSNTLTYTAGDYGPNMAFCSGDSLEIRKVIQAFDAPGRGQGSLLPNIASPTPIRRGQDQVTEPNYIWNNSPQSPTFQPSTGTIRAGEHFFNNTKMPGYTPYTYPHPLVTGNPRTSQPPSSPTATRTSLRKPWGGKQKETKRARKAGRKAKENPTNEMAEGQENLGD
jgi:hypothetical protein